MRDRYTAAVFKAIQNRCRIDGLDDTVVFEPPRACGLANLLRGLTATMLFAEESNRRLFLHWGRNTDMAGIRCLSDFFEQPAVNSTATGHAQLSGLHRFLGYFQGRRVLRFSDWLTHELRTHHQFNTILCDMVANNINLAIPTIVISTYYAFHAGPVAGMDFFKKRHRLYRRFLPAPDIRKCYQDFIDRHFSDYTVGVHIRTKKSMRNRTSGQMDHADAGSACRAPFERYFALLDQEIDRYPHLKILLATDNLTECRPFIDRYKKRLLSYPKNTTHGMVHRFTAEDHKAALIDLYLLAGTRKLLGTYGSTFSYEAAVLGNLPFIEISAAGLRQTYRLIHDKTVMIDLRDNGIGPFTKEMVYDKKSGQRMSFSPADVAGKTTIEWLYGELKQIDHPVWFDVGAGTGAYALISKFLDKCRVYAFEPDRTLVEVLKSNLALNNVQDRVTVCNIGLSDKTGKGRLTLPPGRPYGRGSDVRPRHPAPRTIPTRTDTIDRFVGAACIEKLDLIQIHLLGSEYAILKGARRTLEKFKPRLLLEVNSGAGRQYGADAESLVRWVNAMGYLHRYIDATHIFCESTR